MTGDAAMLPHILVVDDDTRLRKLLHKYLTENGFIVETAEDAAEARARMESLAFDALVLDVMMPGETGLALARALRATSDVPILMLTAMGEVDDRISGLEAGADDYLSKPFEPRELLLRLHSILRRGAPAEQADSRPGPVRLGAHVFHPARDELIGPGGGVHLTSAEAGLLAVLCAHPGAVLSREELGELTNTTGNLRSVDVQVTRLRKKIEDDPRMPRYLQTVRGRGYMLRPD